METILKSIIIQRAEYKEKGRYKPFTGIFKFLTLDTTLLKQTSENSEISLPQFLKSIKRNTKERQDYSLIESPDELEFELTPPLYNLKYNLDEDKFWYTKYTPTDLIEENKILTESPDKLYDFRPIYKFSIRLCEYHEYNLDILIDKDNQDKLFFKFIQISDDGEQTEKRISFGELYTICTLDSKIPNKDGSRDCKRYYKLNIFNNTETILIYEVDTQESKIQIEIYLEEE